MQSENQKPAVHEGMTEVEELKRTMFRTVVRYGLALLAGLFLVLLAPQILRVIVFLHNSH